MIIQNSDIEWIKTLSIEKLIEQGKIPRNVNCYFNGIYVVFTCDIENSDEKIIDNSFEMDILLSRAIYNLQKNSKI